MEVRGGNFPSSDKVKHQRLDIVLNVAAIALVIERGAARLDNATRQLPMKIKTSSIDEVRVSR